MSINLSPVKHVAQRTCVACRQTKAKRELVRLVRTPDRGVEVDLSGRKDGRGAYLCRARECWDTGLRGGRLEYSLKAILSQDNKEELTRLGEEILKEEVGGEDK